MVPWQPAKRSTWKRAQRELWRDLTSRVPTNPRRRHPGKHPILPVGVAHSSSEKPVQPRGWGGRAWGALRGSVCTAHAGSARRLADLPGAARRYLERLEALSGVPVRYVSVGTRRDQIIEV